MKEEKTITINYSYFSSIDEVDNKWKALLEKSIEYAKNAYAPYSKFKVGAALLLANGQVVGGSNQENAAYPSGLCAERVALFAASANNPTEKVSAIAVYTDSESTLKQVISPCGACRQVMNEYEVKQGQEIQVLLMNASKEIWLFESSGDLLPLAFDHQALKKK